VRPARAVERDVAEPVACTPIAGTPGSPDVDDRSRRRLKPSMSSSTRSAWVLETRVAGSGHARCPACGQPADPHTDPSSAASGRSNDDQVSRRSTSTGSARILGAVASWLRGRFQRGVGIDGLRSTSSHRTRAPGRQPHRRPYAPLRRTTTRFRARARRPAAPKFLGPYLELRRWRVAAIAGALHPRRNDQGPASLSPLGRERQLLFARLSD
jgi:hypothetical protein